MPVAMSRPAWERVQQEGRDRAWTRQGRARAAVLSAAARAISGEHLIALVEEQGYQVRLRHSHTNPGQVTGWSIVAPPDKRARSPKAFAGRQLGPDCTWPALLAHIDARGLSDGLGIISAEEGQAMIDRARMAGAGWGAEFIDRVIANDQALIASGPNADPALAYWMRDVFWQVAWALEQSHGQHGVWTDAAYLYSAIATGGPPAPPAEVRAALAKLLAQYDLARCYLDHVEATAARRAEESTAVARRGAVVDRWADSLDARPHIPKYLSSPGGAQYAGAAAVAIALTTADIRTQIAALQHAAEVHRAQAHQLRALAAEDAQALAYVDEQLRPWIQAAKQQEAHLRAALAAHKAANMRWREAAGRLLAEARAAGDQNTALRVSGLNAAYGRGSVLPVAP
jgi:hypothetical protein